MSVQGSCHPDSARRSRDCPWVLEATRSISSPGIPCVCIKSQSSRNIHPETAERWRVSGACNHPHEWAAEPLVSITVLNWNGEHFLRQCLESLWPDRCPHVEVAVIDNGSTDRSVPMVREEFPGVPVIPLPGNLGVAGGRNASVPYLRGRFIVFLDNDVTVERGWLPPLINLMMQDMRIGIATPKVLLRRLPG